MPHEVFVVVDPIHVHLTILDREAYANRKVMSKRANTQAQWDKPYVGRWQ
jgi:hypothetical protein